MLIDSARISTGLSPARARGQKGGHKRRLDPEHERRHTVEDICRLMGIGRPTLYNYLSALQRAQQPHATHRADHGKPRVLPQVELERHGELIAALKLLTMNTRTSRDDACRLGRSRQSRFP